MVKGRSRAFRSMVWAAFVGAGLGCAQGGDPQPAGNSSSSGGSIADGGTIPDASTPDANRPMFPDAGAWDAGPMEECLGVAIPPGPRPARLLTRHEYNNTVRDLLGDTTAPASSMPAENQVLGFENNSDVHVMNVTLLERLLNAAEDISKRAVAERRAMILPCDPAVVGEALCGEMFVESFGRLAYRRPITDVEAQGLQNVFNSALGLYGFDSALQLVIQTALQSPQFLYRLEGAPDGVEGTYTVGGYEMASRLSYFLWSSMPDETLFAAAAAGQLSTREEVETQARRMVLDGRARDAVRSFHRQWLHLEGLRNITKDRFVHPTFTDAMRSSWIESTYRFLDHVYWDGEGTLAELLTSPVYFVDAALAPLYGQPVPQQGFAMVRAEGERAGLITQPALMALLAKPNQASPIHRGIFVRERLLCEALPPPPDDANITPPNPDPNATTRERFAEHTRNESCQACHILIDPVGFGFENYDAVGRYRTMENGRPVDSSGSVTLAPDLTLEGEFNGALELAQRLVDSPTVQQCVVRQHFRAAMGRTDDEADQCTIKQITRHFEAHGGSLRELLVAIAMHEAFRTGDAEPMGGTP